MQMNEKIILLTICTVFYVLIMAGVTGAPVKNTTSFSFVSFVLNVIEPIHLFIQNIILSWTRLLVDFLAAKIK